MKKIATILLAVLTLISICGCAKQNSAETPKLESDGVVLKKQITILVVDDKQETTSFVAETEAEMLGDVLDELQLAQGEEGQYGLFIKTVNGVTTNPDNQEWWCLTKGGESVMTGVDSTPIADGDVFELTFTVGY